MDALEAIFARRSSGRLLEPGPTDDDITTMLRAAAAAPDHKTLRPWRFFVLAGAAKAAFGEVLAAAYDSRCSAAGVPPDAAARHKELTKLGRAPLVIVTACHVTPGFLPLTDQLGAVDAATQNLLLAATALGYGSIWRTGEPAYDPTVKAALGLDDTDHIVGFVYLGTLAATPPPNEPTLDGVVTHWQPA